MNAKLTLHKEKLNMTLRKLQHITFADHWEEINIIAYDTVAEYSKDLAEFIRIKIEQDITAGSYIHEAENLIKCLIQTCDIHDEVTLDTEYKPNV